MRSVREPRRQTHPARLTGPRRLRQRRGRVAVDKERELETRLGLEQRGDELERVPAGATSFFHEEHQVQADSHGDRRGSRRSSASITSPGTPRITKSTAQYTTVAERTSTRPPSGSTASAPASEAASAIRGTSLAS